jgi:hypothetical protein
MSAIDMTGTRWGRLTVIERAATSDPKRAWWRCKCDCGEEAVLLGRRLRSGMTRSCGCLGRYAIGDRTRTHGRSRTPEYDVWCGLLKRCQNPNAYNFSFYGGRGVNVCERWQKFENFLEDMGKRPSRKHTVERLDPEGDYEPSNCRWASILEQANNRRNTRRIIYRGREMALCDAVRAAGSVVHYETAWGRINKFGWTVEDALTTEALQ